MNVLLILQSMALIVGGASINVRSLYFDQHLNIEVFMCLIILRERKTLLFVNAVLMMSLIINLPLSDKIVKAKSAIDRI